MNRKQMLLALGAALLPLKLAQAQEKPRATTGQRPAGPARPLAPPSSPSAPPSAAPPQSGPTLESLQAQIVELQRRLQAVEKAQANSVGFTRSGDDLLLESKGDVMFKPQGNMKIDAAKDLSLRAGRNASIKAAATLELKASVIKQN